MSTQRDDDSAGEDPADGTPDEHRPPDGATKRGPRLAVVAVAAAVLLAGGGGAWWAAASAGGSDGARSDDKPQALPAPLRIDGSGVPGTVTGGPAVVGGSTYELTGTLPKGPASASVHRARGEVGETAVRKLAALLGVDGPVTSDGGTWRVRGGTADGNGTADGAGPALLVGKDAPGTWSYSRAGAQSVQGAGPGATRQDQTAPTGSTGWAGGSPPVSEARAKAVAGPLLHGLGLTGARTDASRVVDAGQTVGAVRTVTADPLVGGLPTHGWTTSVQVGPDGVITAGYGRLAALTKGDSYPVVGAAEALKELNGTSVEHPDHGIVSCRVPTAGPVKPMKPRTPPQPGDSDGSSTAAPAAPAPTRSGPALPPGHAAPAPTTPGQDKTLPRTLPRVVTCAPGNGHPVQVRGARFGLALEYLDGTQALVPAWLFDTAPAGVGRTAVVAQPAVDPSLLQGPVSGGPADPAPTVNPGGPDVPVAPGAPRKVAVNGYLVSGDTLTLTFWGGVCDTYRASASESGSQVRVTVTATAKKPGAVCALIARSENEKVVLGAPLGTRTVVDTSDGQPVKGQ